MTILKGIAASNGIAFGKAYELVEPDLTYNDYVVEDVDKEKARFKTALGVAEEELKKIRQKVASEQGEDNAKIFDAHMLVLQDPELISAVENDIQNEKDNAEQALMKQTDTFITMFEQLDNEYMRERAADIKDVRKRVLSHLLKKPLPNLSLVSEPTIVVAKDLTPSDTAQVNKKYIKGFVTEIGGRTSHSAIMARTLEIPAIVGVDGLLAATEKGMDFIIDGIEGTVIIEPSQAEKTDYENKQADYEKQKAEWAQLKDEATVSKDNVHVELAANIGSYQDIDTVLNNGAEGIGLYRTEFLYMESQDFPTEDEQFDAYKKVLAAMDDKPVVIRTIDIGGDKHLDYWQLPNELNPFLGERAVRLALNNEAIFRTQLRALLRASAFGNLKIMFPMVAIVEEFKKAKALLLNEKAKLENEGVEVANNIEIGIMVEIPATAIMAPQLAKEVDFFSVGTNDLIQYTFAADRMNEKVSYLYQPYHPAILNLVKMVIDAAHQEGKWAGMCGEMAGEPTAIPLLLGLGLDEFSMSPSSILQARTQIKNLDQSEMKTLAEKAIQEKDSRAVFDLVQAIK